MKDHDEIAKSIAQAGRDFVWKKLGMSTVECYWKNLVKSYSSLLKYKLELEDNLQEVKLKS